MKIRNKKMKIRNDNNKKNEKSTKIEGSRHCQKQVRAEIEK